MKRIAVSESRPIPVRTRLLVSVRDADEAALAHESGAEIVDAKDPTRGALGALPPSVVAGIVARLGAGATASAVAGEAESEKALLEEIAAMAATGADYVKVAVPPTLPDHILARAAMAAPGRLIGVLFAEDGIAARAPETLAAAGFAGAMIDTRGKASRRLGDLLPADRQARFVADCRHRGLISGLAGSLRVADIPVIAGHRPDYIGFRGGLCAGGDRRSVLEAVRVRAAAEALRALGQRDAA